MDVTSENYNDSLTTLIGAGSLQQKVGLSLLHSWAPCK